VGCDLVNELELGFIAGLEFGNPAGGEGVEDFLVLGPGAEEFGVGGTEAVLDGVLGRSAASFDGDGAVGQGSVPARDFCFD
jgi:hypothetical protein